MRFLNSADECKRRDPLRFFDIHCVTKHRNKRRGDPLVESKSRIVPKKIRVKNTKGGNRRCFCFGRGSGVSSMFWTSVVQVDDVEQMNKKVDRSR